MGLRGTEVAREAAAIVLAAAGRAASSRSAGHRTGWSVILGLSLAPLVLIQLGMMIAAAVGFLRINREVTM
jgi:hypothetical protein